MNKPSALLIAFMSLAAVANAQQQPWKEGEIEAEQVVIVKERENELPPATRSYQKIPPQAPRLEVRKLSFSSSEPVLRLRPIEPGVRVLRMKQDPPAPYFQRYIKAGIGNYVSPLLEAHLSSPRQAGYLYHLMFRHESAARGPVDGGRSGWGETELRASGSFIGKSLRFTGTGWYARDRFNFYGYDEEKLEPEKDDIKQVYNRLGIRADISNVDQEDYRLDITGTISRVNTQRDVHENKAELEGEFAYNISELLGLQLDASLLTSTYEDVTSRNRTLFRVLPGFTTKLGALELDAGFTFAWENDTAQNADKLHVYPRAELSVVPLENIKAFIGIRGDVMPLTYDALSEQNPFLEDSFGLLFTQKTLELYGGATAGLATGVAASAGFAIANLKNMYFFVNSPTDTTRFDAVYESGNTSYVNVYGQLNFSRTERLGIRLRADYFNYSPEELAAPWHQPAFKFETDVRYNVYDKIYLDAEVFVLSGIKARTIGTENGVTSLDPVINLTLGGEYRFSPQATAFLKVHNLLNKEYERFQNYPSRKLLVRIGGTYAF